MPRTKNTTCLIVDDNYFNIEVLADLLQEQHPKIEILAKVDNGTEAVHLIQQMEPDLIFLDVEMPDMSGFEVLASLEIIDFQTIFVTAHSHYAIQAIRFNALDYLVKPIKPKELTQAIRRYQSKDHARFNKDQIKQALDNIKKENALNQVLFLPTQMGGIKLALKNIVKVVGERNYSKIYLSTDRTELSSKPLGYFEEILSGKGFFRCHRSFIVNRHFIDKIHNDNILLTDSTAIPISRRRKTATKSWFNDLG
jgi:two-component system LytT family response regulator